MCSHTLTATNILSLKRSQTQTDSRLTRNDTHTHKPTATHSFHSSHPRFHLSTLWLWNPEKHTPTLNTAHADSATTGLWHTQAGGNQTRSHPLHIQKEAGRITQPEVLMSSVTHSYKQTLLNGGGSCVEGPFRHLTSVEFSVQMCCWLTSIWAVLIFGGFNEAMVVQMCRDGSDTPLVDSEKPWTALHAWSVNHLEECHLKYTVFLSEEASSSWFHCKTWVDIWNKC